MAKLSKIVKNEKRKKMVEKQRGLRKELRDKVKNLKLSEDERLEAHVKLQKMPRDTCENRIRNRCFLTGRPRGVHRMFRLSRIKIRELAHQGLLPGVTKSSW